MIDIIRNHGAKELRHSFILRALSLIHLYYQIEVIK